jgi:hypothetical protein
MGQANEKLKGMFANAKVEWEVLGKKASQGWTDLGHSAQRVIDETPVQARRMYLALIQRLQGDLGFALREDVQGLREEVRALREEVRVMKGQLTELGHKQERPAPSSRRHASKESAAE